MVIELGTVTLAAAIGYVVRGFVLKSDKKPDITPASSPEPVNKNEEDFSEPVATFIKLFNENPRRFPLTKEDGVDGFDRRFTLFTITDKHKGVSFTVRALHGSLHRRTSRIGIGNVSFLTRLEIDRLFSTIGDYHRKRITKYQQITPERERRVVINLYKDEM